MRYARPIVWAVSGTTGGITLWRFRAWHIATVWLPIVFFTIVFAAITAYYFIETYEASQRDDNR